MGTEYSKQDIESAARLVPEYVRRNSFSELVTEDADGHLFGRDWQPWADTEGGNADWAVLDTAVRAWCRENDIAHSNDLFDAWTDMVYVADYCGDLNKRKAATFAVAVAIGEHMGEGHG